MFMKKIIALILVITMLVIPIDAATVTLELGENEIIYADLVYGWDMNDKKRLVSSDGNVGFVDGKIFEQPVSDIAGESLVFLKSKLLNNIMLVETIGTNLHIYEADATGGTAFVYTLMNEMCDYMFLLCAYQNKISYTAFRNLAQGAVIDYVPQVVITAEPEAEIIEEIIIDEIETEPEPEEEAVPKLGNVIGEVLSTDIVAYIDGMPIASYNVGGKTVVIVEDLVKYGFKVTWDGEARRLIATVGKRPLKTPDYINTTDDLPIGTPVGEVYLTDIVTEINGREYESFSLNGWTAISLESLGDRMIDTDINIYNPYKYSSGGFKTLWDNDTRTINVYCIRPGDMIPTFAGDVEIKASTAVMKPVSYILKNYGIESETISAIDINGRIFADLQKFCELTNITAEMEKNHTITLNSAGKPIEFTNYWPITYNTDMLLPLDIIITNGKTTARSNNNDIAYYYKDGAIMVDIDILMKIVG